MTAGEGKTILIVEDEPEARAALAEFLKANGYSITEAENGEKALKEIERSEVGLVLLDLMMPAMDGRAFLERGRSKNVLRNIPVVVTTARPWQRVQGTAATLGKPLAPQEVLRVVRKYFH